jgi:hypothetical protein
LFKDLLTKGLHGFSGEDHLDREAEKATDSEGQVEARIVFFTFQITYGLEVDAYGLRQLLAGDPALPPEHCDPVIELPGFHVVNIQYNALDIKRNVNDTVLFGFCLLELSTGFC